jgi:hypothetical protein
VQRPLLLGDIVINFLLGMLLLLYPRWLVETSAPLKPQWRKGREGDLLSSSVR